MKNIRNFALVAAIGLTLAPWAVAQAPVDQPTAPAEVTAPVIPPDQQPTKEQVAKLVEVMRIREQMRDLNAQLSSSTQKLAKDSYDQYMKQYCGQCSLKPAQHAALDKIVVNYAAKMSSINSSDQRVDELAALFQLHFSRQDVEASIAFYSSPAGQHILDVKPAIMKEYMATIMKRLRENSAEYINEMTREMRNVILPQSKSATVPTAQ